MNGKDPGLRNEPGNDLNHCIIPQYGRPGTSQASHLHLEVPAAAVVRASSMVSTCPKIFHLFVPSIKGASSRALPQF